MVFYLRDLLLSLVMPLQLAMNMPLVEFSSVQISTGVSSGSPCASLPLALLYATTRWQSPVWTVSPSFRNTFTPVVVILLQYRSQANGHFIALQLKKVKKPYLKENHKFNNCSEPRNNTIWRRIKSNFVWYATMINK